MKADLDLVRDPDPQWRERANCAGTGPNYWYLPVGAEDVVPQNMWNTFCREFYETLTPICRSCQVRAECLADAFESEEPSWVEGMWGGFAPDARTKIRLWGRKHGWGFWETALWALAVEAAGDAPAKLIRREQQRASTRRKAALTA